MQIYIGNLPAAVTEAETAALFTPFGAVVSVRLVHDPLSGKSRGFGFVEMASEEEAARAIAALANSSFGGKTLRVNTARPANPRPPCDTW